MDEGIEMEQGELIWKVLRREGIMLPLSLLQQEVLIEMEEKIRLGYSATYHYLWKIGKSPDSTINKIKCNELIGIIDDFYAKISKEGIDLEPDDEKIIDFLSKNKKINLRTFLELLGPLQMILDIIKASEESEFSKIIKATLALYIFQNMYELLLQLVDRYLYIHLNEIKAIEFYKRFGEVNRMEGEHAWASLINDVFVMLKVVEKENNSIFRIFSKQFRNKIAHFTLFYDSKRDRVVLPNGGELTLEEISKHYKYIYLFMYKWLEETLVDKHIDKNNLEATLKEAFKEAYSDLLHEFKRKFRAGVAKRWGTYILFIVEEDANHKQ